MKHVALTFDDGRSDNCLTAKPIMDKYGFRGTVYITTGFIDGTWDGYAILGSPTRPLTIEEIKELKRGGWDIGLHGDKHKTELEDMRTALGKLKSWGIDNSRWSISVPNSDTSDEVVDALFKSDYGSELAYVRRGRKCDTSRLINKVRYVIYSKLRSKRAYRAFNRENAFILGSQNKANIPCVVVKAGDDPRLIVDFVKRVPDESVIVLMLHSILESDHEMCGKDPWSWDAARLDKLCSELKSMEINGEAEVSTLIEQLKG